MKILNIFEFDSYKELVKAWILNQPKSGHGQYRRISAAIGMSTVMVSQIFNGEREIGVDQAFLLSQYMSLSEIETRFVILLVERARAGNVGLREMLGRQIEAIRREGVDLKKTLIQERELDETQKALFHSNWTYSAVRLLTAIEDFQTLEKIAETLELPAEEVRRVVAFLVENGLVVNESGLLKMGPQRTHLEKTSPFISSRQKTWRVKGFEKMDRRAEEDFFYTGPMSLSARLAGELKQELHVFIKAMSERVVKEKPDSLFCFNIDFFKLSR